MTTKTTALELVKNDQALEALKSAAESVAERANTHKITDELSLTAANVLGTDVASAVKNLENYRQVHIGPLNKDVKDVNGFFHKISSPLKAAKKTLGDKILAWRKAEQKKIDDVRRAAETKAREEERKAQEKADAAAAARLAGDNRRAAQLERSAAKKQEAAETAAVGAAAMVGVGPEKSMSAGGGAKNKTSKHWAFEIEDASKIPRNFLIVDEKAIREAVTKLNCREIPGVRIFETERMSFSSR